MKVCRYCDQPMRPKGVKKKPNEYDHACGCRYHRHSKYCPYSTMSKQMVGRDPVTPNCREEKLREKGLEDKRTEEK